MTETDTTTNTGDTGDGRGLSARTLLARYIALVALRWLPPGIYGTVLVLLAQSRGLSVSQIGLVVSAQGVIVLALELPTGGLSDALGRRPTLMLSAALGLVFPSVLYFAHSLPVFAAAFAIQGVYRALDSGPLEAWYVDATLAVAPDARLERGLSAGGVAAGVAIAVGAVMSSGLVAWRPLPGVERLAVPVLVALAFQMIGLVAVMALVTEPRSRRDMRRDMRALWGSVRQVPQVVGDGLCLLRSSRVLLALVLVEVFWGFGMVAFETLMPIERRLSWGR